MVAGDNGGGPADVALKPLGLLSTPSFFSGKGAR